MRIANAKEKILCRLLKMGKFAPGYSDEDTNSSKKNRKEKVNNRLNHERRAF